MEICDNNSKMEMRCMDEKIRIKDWPKDGEMPIIDDSIKPQPFEEKIFWRVD